MKVCDKHIDRKAIDSIHIQADGTHIDVCLECKAAILALVGHGPPEELGESPIAAPTGEALPKARRGLSFFGSK